MSQTSSQSNTTSVSLPFRRMVLKFGTGLLTNGGDHLDADIMSGLAAQVAKLHKQGAEMVIVSSGAIASGRYKLGLEGKPRDIPYKQVLASVGQSRLMYVYEQLFEQHDITVAQALLTRADLLDRAGYLNARNTLLALLDLRVLCIVNENDVVAVEEIQGSRFGDNDNLSAMVANLVDADLLMILTDIGGLYTADPRLNPGAILITRVESIDSEIEKLAAGSAGKLGTGGMLTKLQAARMATDCGVTVAIADGKERDLILRLASGEELGTRFLPTTSKRESRERWMLSGLCTRGRLIVDAGAALAVKKNKSSLLAAGIDEVGGEFERGDIVNIYDPDGNRIACGIANYGSTQIDAIKKMHSRKIASLLGYDYGSEVVHRNNLVLL